ncbi:MAG: CCA tRNA nucleotidyltransferase [Acidimicrobiales bacterium]
MVPERLQPLVEETRPLAERFERGGHRLYLVGGVVRDALVGRLGPDGDLDFTTDATPSEIESALDGWADAVWDQGRRFGTIGALRHRAAAGGLATRVLEITTHRSEAYHPDSRKPDVAFASAVEADLSRRDFTVNAMALSLPDLRLIDPHGGVADLAAYRLATPRSPDESFSDDPLRMLRAARLIADYGLLPDPGVLDAVGRLRDRLEIVSPERIRTELDKLLTVGEPAEGLWFLVRTGLADEFLPELTALALEQDPLHRHKDVLAHTVAVVEKTSPDRLLRLAALFHDVGKPKTRSFGPGGTVSFHHHETVGARMTRDRMRALRYPTDDIDVVTRLVELHLRFHTYQLGWTDSAVRRYVRDAGDQLARLNELTRCDCTTRNAARARALSRRMDELEARTAELAEREELASLRPDLDGRAVMEHLGIGPGPAVGQALTYLLDLRIEEGPLGPDEARARLDQWWSQVSCPPCGPSPPASSAPW